MADHASMDWKRIADRLADRLASHAFCQDHPVDQPDEACPYCGDRAAYFAYLAAGGQDSRLNFPGARSASVEELLRDVPPRDTS